VPRKDPDPALLRFNTLPTFKLDVLSSLATKHGELLYQRLVGLRIVECRILGVVAHFGPVTLRQTCTEVGIDKGQGSRIVARLLEARLLERRDDPEDQRSFYLLLSTAGRRMHARIAAGAAARNEKWMQGLPAGQHSLFIECLELLTRHTQDMLAEESSRSEVAMPPMPQHEQADPAPDAERPLIVAPAALRDLHRRLGELIGAA
jgi:DNA-binding MarR family transcriptional regulator